MQINPHGSSYTHHENNSHVSPDSLNNNDDNSDVPGNHHENNEEGEEEDDADADAVDGHCMIDHTSRGSGCDTQENDRQPPWLLMEKMRQMTPAAVLHHHHNHPQPKLVPPLHLINNNSIAAPESNKSNNNNLNNIKSQPQPQQILFPFPTTTTTTTAAAAAGGIHGTMHASSSVFKDYSQNSNKLSVLFTPNHHHYTKNNHSKSSSSTSSHFLKHTPKEKSSASEEARSYNTTTNNNPKKRKARVPLDLRLAESYVPAALVSVKVGAYVTLCLMLHHYNGPTAAALPVVLLYYDHLLFSINSNIYYLSSFLDSTAVVTDVVGGTLAMLQLGNAYSSSKYNNYYNNNPLGTPDNTQANTNTNNNNNIIPANNSIAAAAAAAWVLVVAATHIGGYWTSSFLFGHAVVASLAMIMLSFSASIPSSTAAAAAAATAAFALPPTMLTNTSLVNNLNILARNGLSSSTLNFHFAARTAAYLFFCLLDAYLLRPPTQLETDRISMLRYGVVLFVPSMTMLAVSGCILFVLVLAKINRAWLQKALVHLFGKEMSALSSSAGGITTSMAKGSNNNKSLQSISSSNSSSSISNIALASTLNSRRSRSTVHHHHHHLPNEHKVSETENGSNNSSISHDDDDDDDDDVVDAEEAEPLAGEYGTNKIAAVGQEDYNNNDIHGSSLSSSSLQQQAKQGDNADIQTMEASKSKLLLPALTLSSHNDHFMHSSNTYSKGPLPSSAATKASLDFMDINEAFRLARAQQQQHMTAGNAIVCNNHSKAA